MASKVTTLAEAVRPIQDGATIAMAGFGIGSGPIALVHQLIRQGTKNLTVLGIIQGNDVDLLIGAGAVSRVDASGVTLEDFGLAQNFRRAAQNDEIVIREYSEASIYDRFLAASVGLTFWPTRGLFGSDIMKVNPDLSYVTCPFTGERYVAMPVALPEWTLLHAPFADENGNVYHPYRTDFAGFTDVIIRASKRVIVSAEQIVDRDWALSHHHDSLMAGWKAAAVVEAPFGSHPCGLGTLYGPDAEHFREYAQASRDRESFLNYLETYVYGVRDHWGYLERVGGLPRLMKLRPGGAGA